jgi:putative tryptophan/tyrosine transport system substrate-binding protein
MKRREFITLVGGTATAWSFPARGQQGERMRRIGVLMNRAADDPEGQAENVAFVQGLQQSGWTTSGNVRIDYRWTAGDAEHVRKYAAELVALAPDAILTNASPSVAALQQATRTVPIVFVTIADPVGAGFVASLARPGGNTTGFALYEFGISVKWLELLKEIAPRVTRVGVIRDPASAAGIGEFAAIQGAAPSLGVEVSPIGVRDPSEIERAVAAFARSERRPNSDGQPTCTGSSRADYRAGGPPPTARGLLRELLRHRRRPDLLQSGSDRSVPARGQLRRSHPQGREARRPAGAGADQVPARH